MGMIEFGIVVMIVGFGENKKHPEGVFYFVTIDYFALDLA
jgi:hypothetical protein